MQLKALLVDLNDGLDVEDSEVQDVMKKADRSGEGAIDKTEVSRSQNMAYPVQNVLIPSRRGPR